MRLGGRVAMRERRFGRGRAAASPWRHREKAERLIINCPVHSFLAWWLLIISTIEFKRQCIASIATVSDLCVLLKTKQVFFTNVLLPTLFAFIYINLIHVTDSHEIGPLYLYLLVVWSYDDRLLHYLNIKVYLAIGLVYRPCLEQTLTETLLWRYYLSIVEKFC